MGFTRSHEEGGAMSQRGSRRDFRGKGDAEGPKLPSPCGRGWGEGAEPQHRVCHRTGVPYVAKAEGKLKERSANNHLGKQR